MKKRDQIIVSVMVLILICAIAISLAIQVKRNNDGAEKNLKEEIVNYLKPYGKTIIHNDYTVKIDSVFSNEETGKFGCLIVIDAKNYDFNDYDYALSGDNNLFFRRNEDGTYGYVIDVLANKSYCELVNGDIYYYFRFYDDEDANRRENFHYINLKYMGESETDEEAGFVWTTPMFRSEAMQSYKVNGNEIILTDYGIIAEQNFEIITLQAYLKDGEKVFESEAVDLTAQTTKSIEKWYVYSTKKIDATQVEYIEVNGEKYYPEK